MVRNFATGTASHIGAVVFTGGHPAFPSASPECPGDFFNWGSDTFRYAGPADNSISVELGGTVCFVGDRLSGSGFYVINGGSGRFWKAEGSGLIAFTGTLATPNTGAFHLELSGSISRPKPPSG